MVGEDTGPGSGLLLGAGVAGAGIAGVKGFQAITSGFGLKASALALNGSAGLLSQAARQLMGGAAANGTGEKGKGGLGWRNILSGAGILNALDLIAGTGDQVGPNGELKKPAWVDEFNKTFGSLTPRAGAETAMANNADGSPSALNKFLFGNMADGGTLKDALAINLRGEAEAASSTMVATFDQGAAAGQQTINAATTQGALDIAAGLASAAPLWGAAAGAAIRAAIGDIPITVQTAQAPDTGTNGNGER